MWMQYWDCNIKIFGEWIFSLEKGINKGNKCKLKNFCLYKYHSSPLEGGRLDHKYKLSNIKFSFLCFENQWMVPITFQLYVLVMVRKWNHSAVVFTCHTWCIPLRSGLSPVSAVPPPPNVRNQWSPIKHTRGRADQSNPHTPRHPDSLLRDNKGAEFLRRGKTNLNRIAHKNANEKFFSSYRYIWCRRNFRNVVNLWWVNLDFCR